MALSANTDKAAGGTLRARPGPRNFIVKSSSVVYAGALVGLEKSSGHIVPLDDAANRSFVGMALQNVTGDGSLTCAVNVLDFDAESCNVTGYTAVTANGQPVYATADNTLTLTRPTDDAVEVGYTIGYVSSGVGNVAFLGQTGAGVLKLAGSSKKRILLASHALSVIADGGIFKSTMWGHGKITEIGMIAVIPDSTGSKTSILTGAIEGVAITTGALTLTSAGLTPAGTVQKVNPTAANEFHDGDVLTLTAGTTTAFVTGFGQLYIDVEYLL